jgi:hypothetical protein
MTMTDNVINWPKAAGLPAALRRRKQIADLLQHRRDLERALDHLATLGRNPVAEIPMVLGQSRVDDSTMFGARISVCAADIAEWLSMLIARDEQDLTEEFGVHLRPSERPYAFDKIEGDIPF